MSGQYLTTAQLAERWACAPSYVRKLARRGVLAGMRLGVDWRFSLAAVEAYERARTTEPAEIETMPVTTPTAPDLVTLAPGDFELPAGYEPRFPHLWGMTREDAASSAAGRGRTAGRKKTAPQRH